MIEYVERSVCVNLYGCLISDFRFGKMACPPNGAIKIPMAKSKSGNDLGYKFVGIVSNNDPGAVGLSKPHTITKMVIEIVEYTKQGYN